MFKVINIPIPYLNGKQGLERAPQYKRESENIAFNLAKIEFMLLT